VGGLKSHATDSRWGATGKQRRQRHGRARGATFVPLYQSANREFEKLELLVKKAALEEGRIVKYRVTVRFEDDLHSKVDLDASHR
jgi:hypothetical protein